ncbi:MAG: hypothetical protein U0U66_11445 [Cytophagaceae bacterium]
MKKIFIILFQFLFGITVYSQNECLNLPYSKITFQEICNDGSNSSLYLNNGSYKFSANSKYLFVAWGNTLYGGGIMVYHVETKKVVKNFKIDANKNGGYSTYFTPNPVDEEEIAIQISANDIIILNNFINEPDNALSKSPNIIGSNRKIIKTGFSIWVWNYSSKGTNIYIKSSLTGYVIFDKSTGAKVSEKVFSSKEYEDLLISEDDCIVLKKLKDKKDKSSPALNTFNVHHIIRDSIIHSFTVYSLYTSLAPISNNRYLIGYDGVYVNLPSGEVMSSVKDFYKEKSIYLSDESIKVYSIPSLKNAYFMYSGDNKTGMLVGNPCNGIGPIKNMESYQIAANGKYLAYITKDSNELKIYKIY